MKCYHQKIKFTTEILKDIVSYLDVLVSRNGVSWRLISTANPLIHISIYRRVLVIDVTSKGPSHTVKLLGVREFARMRRSLG